MKIYVFFKFIHRNAEIDFAVKYSYIGTFEVGRELSVEDS